MRMNSLRTTSIRRRARALRLPSEVTHQVTSIFLFWVKKSGPEWTCNRMKSIKNDIMKYAATGELPQSLWVEKTEAGNFKGVWQWLQFQAARSPRLLKRVLTLLNMYTGLISSEVTRDQRKKFLSSVEGSRRDVPQEYHLLLRKVARSLPKLPRLYPARKILLSGRRRPSHEQRMLREILEFFAFPTGRQLMGKYANMGGILTPLMDVFGAQRSHMCPVEPSIGEIQYTQEPGFKCRFFAAPHIWIQHCLDPLKGGLLNLVEQLPWDATHDQYKADPWIRTRLQEGRTVHCFDLSDATNVFPLELQMTVMRELLQPQDSLWADLFEEVSLMPWTFEGKQVVWKRGQPLGLGPSFPIFTITHGLLLQALNNKPWAGEYFVLGDDVIILDDDLARAYSVALEELDLPHSPTKSIQSAKYGEFAGRIFHKNGVIQPVKWKHLRDDNIIDMVRNNGPEFISILDPDIQPFMRYLSSLPAPLGFSWSSQGLTLDEAVTGLEHLLWPEEVRSLSYDLDDFKRITDRLNTVSERQRRHLSRNLSYRLSQLLSENRRLQEEEVSKYFPKFLVPLTPVLGRNLYEVGYSGSKLPMAQPKSRHQKARRGPKLSSVIRSLKQIFDALPAEAKAPFGSPR